MQSHAFFAACAAWGRLGGKRSLLCESWGMEAETLAEYNFICQHRASCSLLCGTQYPLHLSQDASQGTLTCAAHEYSESLPKSVHGKGRLMFLRFFIKLGLPPTTVTHTPLLRLVSFTY